jgi:hypothetical protein
MELDGCFKFAEKTEDNYISKAQDLATSPEESLVDEEPALDMAGAANTTESKVAKLTITDA